MMEGSPGECTGIFRMKKTFSEFMLSPGHSRCRTSEKSDSSATRLQYDEPNSKRARVNHSSRSTTSLSVAHVLEADRNVQHKEAEYIRSRSKIVALEAEISSLKTEKKREHIELEDQLQQLKLDKENDKKKMEDLRSQLRYISRCEEDLKTELNDGRETLCRLKHEYEQKLLSLQKNKFDTESEFQQREEQSRQANSKLRMEKCRTDAELQICQSELEETRERCDLLQRKVNDLLSSNNELETLRIKAMNAEQKAGDLQRELATYHDDTAVVKAMKDKILSHADLERENRRLKDDIITLRLAQDNAMLKDEQLHIQEKQLELMDAMRAEMARLQVENGDLTRRLRDWETAANSKQPKSYHDLTRQISDLQSKVAVMLEKQGQLQSSLNSAERAKQCALDELSDLKSHNQNEVNKTTQVDEYMKRLKRRMLLITKERDGYRKMLDSLDGETTVNLTSSRVQTLEETIRDYSRHIDALESQIRHLTEQAAAAAAAASSRTSQAASYAQSMTSRVEDRELIEKLQARVEELELWTEHRNMKGDYDPTKTKVLHLRLNPSAIAQQEKADLVVVLREENEKLRQAIKLLEERQGEVEDLTQIVGVKVHEHSQTKELEEIRIQLSNAELKNKRLMETFKKTSREYREIYYLLTGYQVTFNNPNVKVMSVFSEGPDDFLIFQYVNNTLNLLENEYTATLTELMQQYLLQHASIPAFMAALNMHLFSRQTMIL